MVKGLLKHTRQLKIKRDPDLVQGLYRNAQNLKKFAT
jgi:hypothetical protein